MIKEGKAVELKDQGITYGTAFALRRLIGRLGIDCYDDKEAIESVVKKLETVMSEFSNVSAGDQSRAHELSNTESTLTKKDIAYLSLTDFKKAIFQRGFEFDHVGLLEYWLVNK